MLNTKRLINSFWLALLTACAIASFPAHASADTQQVADPQVFPYQRTFIISAYYSPLENQKKYVTGSFNGDVRLNGEGVHSADGSIVFPGMIAAPKGYSFGTKMKIPGIGVVAVHDRGGAIVHAGARNQAYDRLDVWMGYGDSGLQRALNWGRRTVAVTVYGIDPNINENVYLEGYSEAEKIAETAMHSGPKIFTSDLNLNDQSDGVKKLQDSLTRLGYYHAPLSGTYDTATEDSVITFQVDAGVVDSRDDFGAGYFGPQTRKSLEDALQNHDQEVKKHLPQAPLIRDAQGDDVRKLQEALQKLGYQVDVTGIYDNQTIDAIFKFQQDQHILKSASDVGAGAFGPKTMEVLASQLSNVTFDQVHAESIVYTPVIVFHHDLKLGESGDDVRRLQEELKRMNLLGIDPSGYYGDVTRHAVLKFQQSQNILSDPDDPAAGYFGPATRERLHAIIGERQHLEELVADKSRAKPEEVAVNN